MCYKHYQQQTGSGTYGESLVVPDPQLDNLVRKAYI